MADEHNGYADEHNGYADEHNGYADEHNGYLVRFVHGTPFEIFILVLVAFSVGMLMWERIVDLPVSTARVLVRVDMVVLGIFAFEFVVKLYCRKKEYFLDDYGWIDFLSIVPIFTPALKALRSVKMLRGVRILRILRFLRMLRLLRFLKVAKQSESALKQKIFVPISTATMILVLAVGYFLVNWQRGVLYEGDEAMFQAAFAEAEAYSPQELLDRHPAVQVIWQGEETVAARYALPVLEERFLTEHLAKVDGEDVGAEDIGVGMLFLVKDTYRKIQQIELFVMLISIFTIALMIVVLNRIVGRIVLEPIAMLSDAMDRVVREVRIPNTDETRKEIRFDVRLNYWSDDEIGVLAEKYDFLLDTLEEKNRQSKEIFGRIVNSMMNLFGEFHHITRGHQVRTARIASALAYRTGASEEDREKLFYGMMLHDLGKVGVDKNVLTKAGTFTDEDRQEMNRHSEIGYEIAKDFPLISTQELTVIREHHEKLDGTGYPYGLRGDRLSPLSRISVVSDIFDALCCPRDYKEAKPMSVVREIMDDMSGTHIDPKVYTELVTLVDEGIIEVKVSGETPEEEWIRVDESRLGAKVSFGEDA